MGKLSLDRILQSQGFGTRKLCRELIRSGEVVVAGQSVTDYQIILETNELKFTVFGEVWNYQKHVYIAMNKPANFECSRKPTHYPGVLTLLPVQFTYRSVQPVGRLDHDTSGLLLLSDDGNFIHSLSSPKRHVSKTYVATTHELVTTDLIQQLLMGVKLHDEPELLAAISCEKIANYEIKIVLDQGKYHQVKRMLAAAGNHCAGLQRTAIGNLSLSALKLESGEWCSLNSTQLFAVRSEQV